MFWGLSNPGSTLPEVVAVASGVGTVGTAGSAQPSVACHAFGG